VNIRINKVHFPVTVLGPGQRIGIWMQGCSIGCEGCCSRDTWEPGGGGSLPVDTLLEWCRGIAPNGVDGITVSGGEPFDQPEALEELLRGLRCWRDIAQAQFDVLVYTGNSRRRIESRYRSHLDLIDVLVPGPYRAGVAADSPLAGSGNQRVWYVNDAVRANYEHWLGQLSQLSRRPIQAAVDDCGVWLIGIPRSGDLGKLQKSCAEAGLTLSDASWRC
jgi:anaerobic ribonucleoside-triphosphate reductase activating protein